MVGFCPKVAARKRRSFLICKAAADDNSEIALELQNSIELARQEASEAFTQQSITKTDPLKTRAEKSSATRKLNKANATLNDLIAIQQKGIALKAAEAKIEVDKKAKLSKTEAKLKNVGFEIRDAQEDDTSYNSTSDELEPTLVRINLRTDWSSFGKGVQHSSTNIVCNASEALEIMDAIKFDQEDPLNVKAIVGTAKFAYEGVISQDRSIFVGFNAYNEYMVRFMGAESLRGLNSILNLDCVSGKLKSSVLTKFNLTSTLDLDESFTDSDLKEVISIQATNRPAITFKDGELQIGGSQSAELVKLKLNNKQALIHFSLSQTNVKNLIASKEINKDTAILDVALSMLYNKLNKIKANALLNRIREAIASQNNVISNVKTATVGKDNVVFTNSKVKSVSTALSVIKNKLFDPVYSVSSQEVFLKFIDGIVKKHNSIIDGKVFLTEIIQLIIKEPKKH